MKPTKRKAFNFLRSYFDVLNELKTDSDKLNFLLSIINKQFLNEEPEKLNFIVNLCYESQRHQIESSVKGWERASKEALGTTPPTPKGTTSPTTPKEEEEKEEEEVKEKVKEFDFIEEDYKESFNDWLDYKKDRREKYKSEKSIKLAYNKLKQLSNNNKEIAREIVNQSMANNWAGLFELKNKPNGHTQKPITKREPQNASERGEGFITDWDEAERLLKAERDNSSNSG